jgi:acetaldehyde dehydrogenase (acetylating)
VRIRSLTKGIQPRQNQQISYFTYTMNAEVQYITDDKGEKKIVIMNISDYQLLMEDVQDLAACAERRNEETISHKEFLEELKKDGLL